MFTLEVETERFWICSLKNAWFAEPRSVKKEAELSRVGCLYWIVVHPVESDSLWPHGLQHVRPACPSQSKHGHAMQTSTLSGWYNDINYRGVWSSNIWPPDVKNWPVEKTLMLGKVEGRRRRGWQRMRWLDGITNLIDEFEQVPGVGDGQGSLVCCSPWGHKESNMAERLNWTDQRGWCGWLLRSFSTWNSRTSHVNTCLSFAKHHCTHHLLWLQSAVIHKKRSPGNGGSCSPYPCWPGSVSWWRREPGGRRQSSGPSWSRALGVWTIPPWTFDWTWLKWCHS